MFCKNCGNPISENQMFCGVCGAPIAANNPNLSVATIQKKSKKGLVMTLCIVLSLLIAGGTCLAVFWDDIFKSKKISSDDKDKTSNVTAEEDEGAEEKNPGKGSGGDEISFTALAGQWKGSMNLNNAVDTSTPQHKDFTTTAKLDMIIVFSEDGTCCFKANANELSAAMDTLINDMIFYLSTNPEFEKQLLQSNMTITDYKNYIKQNLYDGTKELLSSADSEGNISSEPAAYSYSNGVVTVEMDGVSETIDIEISSNSFRVKSASKGLKPLEGSVFTKI